MLELFGCRLIMNVLMTKHVLGTNAKILVLEYAASVSANYLTMHD